jgi:zinc transporter
MTNRDTIALSCAGCSLRVAESTYGSDKVGLVWAYLFTPGDVGRPVGSDDVAHWLSAGADSDRPEFFWLHFSLANAACKQWLQQNLSLPDSFYESLNSGGAQRSSTRVEVADDTVVAVLNDVLFSGVDTSDAATVSLCADHRVLVSARTSPLRSVDRLRASVKSGDRVRSTAELLAHLLRDQADVLVEIVRDATVQIDVIEDKLFKGRALSSRPKLGSLRRLLVRLQRLLAPEPAALFRLLNRPPGWMSGDDVQDLRQSAEELSAAVADCASLVERVRLIQEELIALVNEQTNRTLYILTVVTVLALPLTIISGFLGMNVGGVPFRDHDSGFWVVVALTTTVSALAAWFAFGRRGDS